jgi:acyl-coenzyme A synthetase/AMP-(fatty) acid ligase
MLASMRDLLADQIVADSSTRASGNCYRSAVDSIADLLERRARDDAAKPFCLFDDASISFADLHDRVNRLANGFAALGLHPGNRVAVILANHPDHPVVFLALARLGVTQPDAISSALATRPGA